MATGPIPRLVSLTHVRFCLWHVSNQPSRNVDILPFRGSNNRLPRNYKYRDTDLARRGQMEIMSGGTDVGTAIMLNSGGQNVCILDYKDTRPGGFGVGF